MKKHFTAEVRRTVTDTISLSVEGEDEADIYVKAKQAAAEYPSPVTVEGVTYIYTENRMMSGAEVTALWERDGEDVA